MAQQEAIGLHFRVADNTAQELQAQLNTIVEEINKKPFEIKFTYNKQEVDEMKKAIKDLDSLTQKSNKRSGVQNSFVSDLRSAAKQAEKILNKPLDVKQNKQAFADIRNQIEETYTAVKKYKDNLSAAFDGKNVTGEAEAQLHKLEQLIQQYDSMSSQDKNDAKHLKTLQSTSLTYDKLINKLTQYYVKYKKLIESSPQHMSEYEDLLRQLRGKGFESVQRAAQAVQQFTIDIRDAGLETETLGQRLKRVFGQKLEFGTLATLALYVRQFATKVYVNVKDIDTAMLELRKVTDETEGTYSHFLDSAVDRAQNLGAKLTDVINATADFARLGYGIEDASTLADVATVYKNVGDGIEDISTASESIISTMQAFGIAASDAMSIVDKFNITGKIYCPAA